VVERVYDNQTSPSATFKKSTRVSVIGTALVCAEEMLGALNRLNDYRAAVSATDEDPTRPAQCAEGGYEGRHASAHRHQIPAPRPLAERVSETTVYHGDLAVYHVAETLAASRRFWERATTSESRNICGSVGGVERNTRGPAWLGKRLARAGLARPRGVVAAHCDRECVSNR